MRVCEEVLELLSQEELSAPRTVAQVCNDGFQLALLAGDTTEVQSWAHLSYEAHRLGWGRDYPMTKQMQHYVMYPPTLADGSGGAGKKESKKETRGTSGNGQSMKVAASPPTTLSPSSLSPVEESMDDDLLSSMD
eukprot:TRINITY_DN59431_c0_g1_i2.p2 TRINITY_DN59431_c0_g1~~TRINITY_DN59431_c0_g1_i2.p2  ORF type:complete len:148 (+),score=38.98 TRINITY_DN59431_c0_g1_i2:41-445(+)